VIDRYHAKLNHAAAKKMPELQFINIVAFKASATATWRMKYNEKNRNERRQTNESFFFVKQGPGPILFLASSPVCSSEGSEHKQPRAEG